MSPFVVPSVFSLGCVLSLLLGRVLLKHVTSPMAAPAWFIAGMLGCVLSCTAMYMMMCGEGGLTLHRLLPFIFLLGLSISGPFYLPQVRFLLSLCYLM